MVEVKMKISHFLIMFLCINILGCANFNPRNQMPINNQGKIDEIKNNQNGVMAEIGKLKQTTELLNSQLKEVQNGLLNVNAAVSRNENSGVQILQGDGSLMLIFSISVMGMFLFYYHNQAKTNQKAAEIMAQEIANFNDPYLNDKILSAAMHTPCEKRVFNMLNDAAK